MEEPTRLMDIAAWREAFVHFGSELVDKVSGFLPQLLAALLILGFGWLIARGFEMKAAE